MKKEQATSKEVDESRRKFIKGAGLVIGGAVLGGVGGHFLGLGKGNPKQEHNDHAPQQSDPAQAMMYFSNPEDFKALEAACERIFPEDELGPGAKLLGAAYFIDHQLAGNWGNNTKEYMSGPFLQGQPEQGYQTHLRRNEIFSLGVAGLRKEALKRHSGEESKGRFAMLTPEQQDAILSGFEAGKVDLDGLSSAMFFGLLVSATIEGVYSDPMYGGNKDMGGWKMKNFPGSQMSFYDQIDQPGGMPQIDPVSLNQHMHM
jgi:gluconate 2-dehydrogenase gamma chain